MRNSRRNDETTAAPDKLDTILRVAAACFSEKGFDATSLEEIAKKVNLHKATLYHYIESKQDILYQCLTRSFDDYGAPIEMLSDETVPVLDRLRRFFHSLAQAQNSVFGKCVAGVGAKGLGHEPGSRIREFRREIDHAIRELIEEGISRGEIRQCRVQEVSAIIFGAFNWVATWHSPDKGFPLEEIVDAFLDIVINGLVVDPELWLENSRDLSRLSDSDFGLNLVHSKVSEQSDKRIEILTTAAQFFSKKGYDGTSLKEISQKVGLHKATLYHYVSSKGDLVYQCLERSFIDLDDVMNAIDSSDADPTEKLMFFLKHLIKAQNSDFGRCLNLISPDQLPPDERELFILFKGRLDKIVQKLLSESVDAGKIRYIHPTIGASFLFGASNWVPHWRKSGDDPGLDTISGVLFRVFFAGIVAR